MINKFKEKWELITCVLIAIGMLISAVAFVVNNNSQTNALKASTSKSIANVKDSLSTLSTRVDGNEKGLEKQFATLTYQVDHIQETYVTNDWFKYYNSKQDSTLASQGGELGKIKKEIMGLSASTAANHKGVEMLQSLVIK